MVGDQRVHSPCVIAFLYDYRVDPRSISINRGFFYKSDIFRTLLYNKIRTIEFGKEKMSSPGFKFCYSNT